MYSIAGRRRVWTTQDGWDVADGLAQGKTYAQIAKAMGRSANSVKVYCARRVKVRDLRPLTARGVAALLGLGCSKVASNWISRGWLHGRKARGITSPWYVTEDALMRFLEAPAHWHRWEPSRITEFGLREWALALRTERYLTQTEVARRYFVIPQTVAQWIDRGLIRAVDTGSHRLIPESALDGFVLPSERSKGGKSARRFTPEEDARLLALRGGGASWHECEYQLRRNMGSCVGRYARLKAAQEVLAL